MHIQEKVDHVMKIAELVRKSKRIEYLEAIDAPFAQIEIAVAHYTQAVLLYEQTEVLADLLSR